VAVGARPPPFHSLRMGPRCSSTTTLSPWPAFLIRGSRRAVPGWCSALATTKKSVQWGCMAPPPQVLGRFLVLLRPFWRVQGRSVASSEETTRKCGVGRPRRGAHLAAVREASGPGPISAYPRVRPVLVDRCSRKAPRCAPARPMVVRGLRRSRARGLSIRTTLRQAGGVRLLTGSRVSSRTPSLSPRKE